MNNKPVFLNRSLSEWFSSLPVLALLLLTLIIGTGEMLHGQLLRFGERTFGDPTTNVQYFMLRADPVRPACDPNKDIDAAVQAKLNAPVSDDPLDMLFADAPQDPEAIRSSLEAAKALCIEKNDIYERVVQNITPELKAFRAVETGFFGIFKFGTENRPLILLAMFAIAAITTTLGVHHINLRPPKTQKDFFVYNTAMVVANVILAFSSWYYYTKVLLASGIPVDKPLLNYIFITLFVTLAVISAVRLLRPPQSAPAGGNFGMSLLTIPLFAFMAMTSAATFFADQHWAGIAIYLGQLLEYSGIFLNLALYIWAGMLLKQTRVVTLFMDIVRPWKLSPEALTWVILLAAAIPTAYTGASGIFVIAAGAIVYKEVYSAGGRRQMALAAAAMSGSMGVVLRPCLLIVLIAALNKQVTTNELYGWGVGVFMITSTLFLLFAMLVKEDSTGRERAVFTTALRESARALVPVSPYIVITLLVVYGYKFLLDAQLDEFTAPVMLPVIMLFIVIFDKIRREPKAQAVAVNPEAERRLNLEQAVRYATNETIGHIGALIMLMALSVSVGGVIEHSGIMESVPADMGSIWVTLTILMFMMVFIGMIMDPFGAVILVSATVAPIAYSNGINPIHFWMIVLAAFELGYLSPPVALNQLLTRMVVGEEEMDAADAEVRHKSFYYRYERWILPVVVMFSGLLIVVYGGQNLVMHGLEWQEAIGNMMRSLFG
ncbi:TRAP-type C4-dicarboxylate transport system permease large subunit [Paraperlucidibaca baekdonensis]|uniref:TRAP-type C4-dicarboxylate transport system permease large subunit n=1 Tax=Paraperlucidibaca baekdonensis TaxID=748120 RepID=A0A3E0H8B0_9GAMM|nr:TRAP transporter large permease subunit [Paraperlucidibaca baekdonensis]REH39833.1 TRAP-type C4-dicarboxylate transport system permease large subunit [Paraperlucidibaca baekdonensis]